MRIHHIGYLVKKIDKAKDSFISIGFSVKQETIYDQFRDVNILFMEKDGYMIELVSPHSEKSVVAHLMKTYKNSPYHICYESENFNEDTTSLAKKGFMSIDQPAPAPALNGRRVCFFISPQIGIIELLEGGCESECL